MMIFGQTVDRYRPTVWLWNVIFWPNHSITWPITWPKWAMALILELIKKWRFFGQKCRKNGQKMANFWPNFFFHLMAHFPLTIAGTIWNKTLDFLKNDEFRDFILETAKIMIFGQNAVGFLAFAVLIFNLFWQNLHQLWCLKGFRGMRWNFWKILKIGHFMAKMIKNGHKMAIYGQNPIFE